jgi:Putative GTPase activating protein for Arf
VFPILNQVLAICYIKMADQKEFKRRLKVLMNKSENMTCVDCNERQPRWASLIKPAPGSSDTLGMGAFMCLECSGSHRRLGVHISFVRSVNLDSCTFQIIYVMALSLQNPSNYI